MNEGLRVPGGSDSISQPEGMNPFWGIWCAVARKTFFDKDLCPEEKISIMDAIRMFTNHSAYAGFEEDVKGSIELTKLGDLIVLAEDPFSVPIDKLRDIQVETTIIDGKIVYQRNK
jgi:predicted amidohydrolase YtcJ